MELFDSHAHLCSEELFSRIDEVIEDAKKAGVQKILNICLSKEEALRGVELSAKYKNRVFLAAGADPHAIDNLKNEDLFSFIKTIKNSLIAIGEIGLDYYYKHLDKKKQIAIFEKGLLLAKELNLPIIIHCREAFEDLFSICSNIYFTEKTVIHCFTGTKNEAKRALDNGWMLSFSGIITFPKADALREVLKYVPMDRIFIETDSPLLAPQSKRGKVNEPKNLVEIANKVADVKGVSPQVLAEQTLHNARLTSINAIGRSGKL